MTSLGVFLIVVKVLIVIMFLLNMAAISVWADRRQSAMVQDRVGPNRAVVYLPSMLARAFVFLPGVLLAFVLSYSFWQYSPGVELARITTGIELGIFLAWFSLLVLSGHVRRHGAENGFDEAVGSVDPRNYFYVGLGLHLLALPLVRAIPESLYYGPDGSAWGPGLAGGLAGVVAMSCALYAAAKVPDGRVGLRLAGTLHAVADAIKLIWKEDLRPKNADKLLYGLAPLLAMFPALVTFGVLPFGSTMCFTDANGNGALEWGDVSTAWSTEGMSVLAHTVDRAGACGAAEIAVPLQIADLNIGLLYIFAIGGTGIIGAALAGWASDNKFALLGGLRATSQMVSYEVAMGLSIVGMLMVAGSVHMQEIVDWQGENTWGLFAQPLAFFLFFAAVVAETKRVPFDQPEGESEIVAGYFLEYSGMKFGLFFLGEYAEFVFSSALMVTLFFGGYHLPFLHGDGITVAFGDSQVWHLPMSHLAVTVTHFFVFFAKVLVFAWLHVFIRWTLPRFRYDQLMKLGWTKLLPLALANIIITALVLLAIDAGGAGAAKAIDIACDITQAIVAIAGLAAAVAFVTWLLEPTKRRDFAGSTSARFAAAEGGVKPGEMQA